MKIFTIETFEIAMNSKDESLLSQMHRAEYIAYKYKISRSELDALAVSAKPEPKYSDLKDFLGVRGLSISDDVFFEIYDLLGAVKKASFLDA